MSEQRSLHISSRIHREVHRYTATIHDQETLTRMSKTAYIKARDIDPKIPHHAATNTLRRGNVFENGVRKRFVDFSVDKFPEIVRSEWLGDKIAAAEETRFDHMERDFAAVTWTLRNKTYVPICVCGRGVWDGEGVDEDL